MSESAFDGHILSEKLTKLNSSQQSIESLSRWCISHRKRAKQIVETWDKLFKLAQKEQRVSFLYLSNDILQNSRRRGTEFVNEFWKVLPATLKNVYESGDENGKKAASRLVDIWDERKVFGSRGQNLKNELKGNNTTVPSPLASNGKGSNPIKIVKRDAHSLRIKLAVGGMPEKILTGFHLVHDENVNEESALKKCKDAVSRVGEIERDVESMSARGNLQGSGLVGEIQEQKILLQQCATQLESSEASRAALVFQLKEALQDQETELELIRSQLQVVHKHIKKATNVKESLTSPRIPSPPITTYKQAQTVEPTRGVEINLPPAQLSNLPPLSQPMMSFSATITSEEESKKAAAAAMAAKLTASTSSVEMLSSVLSSFVAGEAAATMSTGLESAGLSVFSMGKRQRLEKPMVLSDGLNSDTANTQYYALQPPPPPLPPGQPSNSPANQFVQSAGMMMMGVMPYGYTASSLPPPPPPPPPPPLPLHISMGLARPPLQPPLSPQQQHTGGSGYYRPPGISFYGQSNQQTPSPVPRQ